MDYEKLYKEALERAKYWEKEPTVWSSDDICQKIFPELRESEDERIRKEMIFYFTEEIPQCSIQEHSDKMREFISWLKRQEIERTKLKAGNSYFCYKSLWERADNETFKKGLIYKCNKDGVLDNFVIKNPEQHFIEIKDERIAWLEKQGEQKPIMIQWKGDNLREVVKFTGKSPKFNEWFKTWDDYENYVQSHGNIFKLFWEDGSHYEVPVGAWIVKTPDGYNVASKAVFKQKPADKAEPKFKIGDRVNQNDREDEEYNILTITSVDIDEHCYICHQESVIDFEEQDLWHIVKQNPAWSEEDEQILNEFIESLRYYNGNGYNKQIAWLKSLKDRIQLQPISEWSEEDERNYKGCLAFFKGIGTCSPYYQDYLWLKSLKPQNRWKPSEQNIKDLEWCADLVKDKMGVGFHRLQVFIDEIKNL